MMGIGFKIKIKKEVDVILMDEMGGKKVSYLEGKVGEKQQV